MYSVKIAGEGPPPSEATKDRYQIQSACTPVHHANFSLGLDGWVIGKAGQAANGALSKYGEKYETGIENDNREKVKDLKKNENNETRFLAIYTPVVDGADYSGTVLTRKIYVDKGKQYKFSMKAERFYSLGVTPKLALQIDNDKGKTKELTVLKKTESFEHIFTANSEYVALKVISDEKSGQGNDYRIGELMVEEYFPDANGNTDTPATSCTTLQPLQHCLAEQLKNCPAQQ